VFKKSVIVFACVIILLISSVQGFAFDIDASCAALMIADTGELIYTKNADVRRPMASTTKIMTALIALESGDLDREITVTDEMINVEGTSMGLLPGDTVSLEELVYGMLLQSGNDAANCTAYAVSGGVDEFLALMNCKAEEIGMRNTHFATPSGLDADEHYSTAYDMALLASYALANPVFRRICSTYSASLTYGNPPYARRLTNHNRLLKIYDGAIGVKTGFTKKSGRCLVSAAQRDGLVLVCVTLNDSNDWDNHSKLLDYGFENTNKQFLDFRDNYDIPVVSGNSDRVSVTLTEKPFVYSVSEKSEIKADVYLDSFVYAPVQKGDRLGCLRLYGGNGRFIKEIPFIADGVIDAETESADRNGKSVFDRIIKYIKGK